MAFSFHRETTSLFVKGRYHENVIDLNNPTHKGLYIGEVSAIEGRSLELVTQEPLERFDGLRVDAAEKAFHARPQHGDEVKTNIQTARRKYANQDCQFSLREFTVGGMRLAQAATGDRVRIQLPSEIRLPHVGDLVYKIRSNELKRHTEALSQPPADARMRPLRRVDMIITTRQEGEQLQFMVETRLGSATLLQTGWQTQAQRPAQDSRLADDLKELLSIFGESGVEVSSVELLGDFTWFIPRSRLKQLKKQLADELSTIIPLHTQKSQDAALQSLDQDRSRRPPARTARYQVKIDRLEYLEPLAKFCREHTDFTLDALIFEPKRAFLGKLPANECFIRLQSFAAEHRCKLRLALPTVIRAWDEPLLRPWLRVFLEADEPRYEVGNLGALELLREAGCTLEEADLSSDFTLYALNTEAALALREHNIRQIALSLEDDLSNIRSKLRQWPERCEPVAILYKDTPLFIAEACSLTALHQGCPSSAVCGYRTLEIENDEGERFHVAHETCKSIVYGKLAFGLSQHKTRLMELGVDLFRIDFLTRSYNASSLTQVLRDVHSGSSILDTHCANFERELL